MVKTKHNIIAICILGIALAIVIVVVGGVSWHRASAPVTQPQTAQNNPSGTAATSTASSTLSARVYTPHPPHGSVTYQVAQAATQLPGFVQATIDPVDVSVGQVQHFTIVTDDPNPVVSVIAQITTDHKVITVPLVSQGMPSVSMLAPRTITVNSDNQLALIPPGKNGANNDAVNVKNGANVANAATANDTKFIGQWTVEDTHTARYKTVFTAKDSVGNTNSVTVNWTDPLCPFTSVNNYAGGTSTISSSCAMPYSATPDGISNVDGPEHGNLLISGALNMSPFTTLVLNNNGANAYGISFSGGGTLLIASGSQIIFNQDMCGTDNDGDGYISGSNWTATSSCGGMASRSTNGISAPFLDCNDSDANVHPGQTAFFTASTTTDLGAGTYDYNCDGTATKQRTATSTYTCGSNLSCVNSGLGCAGLSCQNTQSGTGGWQGSVPDCGVTSTYVTGFCGSTSYGPVSGACGIGCSFGGCNTSPLGALQAQACN